MRFLHHDCVDSHRGTGSLVVTVEQRRCSIAFMPSRAWRLTNRWKSFFMILEGFTSFGAEVSLVRPFQT